MSNAAPVPHPGQPRHGVRQGGHGRVEAERLRPQGAVPHPCDGLVETRIPAQEALVHPGGDARMGRARAIDDEMGQRQNPQDNHPGQHERQERLARLDSRLDQRRRKPERGLTSRLGPVSISRAAGRTR